MGKNSRTFVIFLPIPLSQPHSYSRMSLVQTCTQGPRDQSRVHFHQPLPNPGLGSVLPHHGTQPRGHSDQVPRRWEVVSGPWMAMAMPFPSETLHGMWLSGELHPLEIELVTCLCPLYHLYYSIHPVYLSAFLSLSNYVEVGQRNGSEGCERESHVHRILAG